MFKPQFDEYIYIPKKRLKWIYDNIYLCHYFRVYSSKEMKYILDYLNGFLIR